MRCAAKLPGNDLRAVLVLAYSAVLACIERRFLPSRARARGSCDAFESQSGGGRILPGVRTGSPRRAGRAQGSGRARADARGTAGSREGAQAGQRLRRAVLSPDRSRRGRPHHAGLRRRRRPKDVLPRGGAGRRVEEQQRRLRLDAAVRRTADAVRRIARGGRVRPQRHLRRLGRSQHPRQRRDRHRHFQVHRCRQDLDAGVEDARPDRHARHPSR